MQGRCITLQLDLEENWGIVDSVARRGDLSESGFGSNMLRRPWKGACVDKRRGWFKGWDGLRFLFK